MDKKKMVSNEMILKAVHSLDLRENDLPTKEDVRAIVGGVVEKAKEELLVEIRPVAKAVDKDAVTIINHESRITGLERR